MIIANISDNYTPYVHLDTESIPILYPRPKDIGDSVEMFVSEEKHKGQNALVRNMSTYVVRIEKENGVFKIKQKGDLGISLKDNIEFGKYFTLNAQ